MSYVCPSKTARIFVAADGHEDTQEIAADNGVATRILRKKATRLFSAVISKTLAGTTKSAGACGASRRTDSSCESGMASMPARCRPPVSGKDDPCEAPARTCPPRRWRGSVSRAGRRVSPRRTARALQRKFPRARRDSRLRTLLAEDSATTASTPSLNVPPDPELVETIGRRAGCRPLVRGEGLGTP